MFEIVSSVYSFYFLLSDSSDFKLILFLPFFPFLRLFLDTYSCISSSETSGEFPPSIYFWIFMIYCVSLSSVPFLGLNIFGPLNSSSEISSSIWGFNRLWACFEKLGPSLLYITLTISCKPSYFFLFKSFLLDPAISKKGLSEY